MGKLDEAYIEKFQEEIKEGDFVSIYSEDEDRVSECASLDLPHPEHHGVVVGVYDIPNTFGRMMYYVFVNGQVLVYDDAFWKFKVLSRASG